MDDDSHSEIEVKPYEEIVNLNYSTPIASSASSPFCYEEDQLNNAQLHVPIVFSSESEVVSASTGLVASVTWPDLRYPCSLAGSYQEPRLLQHPDGNRATQLCLSSSFTTSEISYHLFPKIKRHHVTLNISFQGYSSMRAIVLIN